jgi:hypothetical protein
MSRLRPLHRMNLVVALLALAAFATSPLRGVLL